MLLREPSSQDISKIHAEINQIVNHRFLLTMAAISVFGVIVAWLIPRNTPQANDPIGSFVVEGIILLLMLLFLLYLYSHLLNGMVRTLSGYLIVTNASPWEQSWLEYRKYGRYWAYTKPQSVVFMVLGALAAGFPISLAFAYSLRYEPLLGLITLGVIVLLYELFIWLMGFQYLWSIENNAHDKWREFKTRKDTS